MTGKPKAEHFLVYPRGRVGYFPPFAFLLYFFLFDGQSLRSKHLPGERNAYHPTTNAETFLNESIASLLRTVSSEVSPLELHKRVSQIKLKYAI
jgi:hypothetical protein